MSPGLSEFANNHYFITFILVYVSIGAIGRIVARAQKMTVVLVRGYPPEHCDVDGDFADYIETEATTINI